MHEIHTVAGSDQMVHFLKRNAGNTNGVDGSIYEATAAMRVKRGEVPGVGVLERIAADGEEATRKIDAISSTHSLQMKFKGAGSVFVPSDIGGSLVGCRAYLDEFVGETNGLPGAPRIPCLLTNLPVNDDLASELAIRSISHRLIAP